MDPTTQLLLHPKGECLPNDNPDIARASLQSLHDLVWGGFTVATRRTLRMIYTPKGPRQHTFEGPLYHTSLSEKADL